MKVLNFVLITIFLCAWMVQPAHAQTGERYTFTPLVTKADANVPLWVQAQQVYERLLPALMKAKKQGKILEWQPEFKAGILGIKYAANAQVESFNNAAQTEDFHAALALVPQQQGKANPEGGIGLSFELTLFSSCFYAYALPANAYVKGMLYDKTGKFLASSLGQVKPNTGYLFDCFEFGTFNAVMPGSKVSFQIYDSTNTNLIGTFTVIAPTIEATDFYQAQAIVAGKGPKNKPYYVDWYHIGLGGEAGQAIVKSSTTSAQGDWKIDLSNKVAMRGGDYMHIHVQQALRFTFDRFAGAPFIECQLGENYCTGRAAPFQQTTVALVHAGQTYTVSNQADYSGWFSADFYDDTHAPVLLTKGDQVNVTGLPKFTLPNMTVKINFATDVISGVVPMNSPLELGLYLPQTSNSFYRWGKSDATSNHYSIDVTSFADLKANQIIQVNIIYFDPVTGNRAGISFAYIP